MCLGMKIYWGEQGEGDEVGCIVQSSDSVILAQGSQVSQVAQVSQDSAVTLEQDLGELVDESSSENSRDSETEGKSSSSSSTTSSSST